METRKYLPHFIVIGLMSLTALAIAYTVDTTISDEAGVLKELPSKVGSSWEGSTLRFCQQSGCLRDYTVSELTDINTCPACGGELKHAARGEIGVLPKDTFIVKKKYQNELKQQLVAAIVMSGKERVSIHRPELCLPGQGSTITNSYVVQVPIEGREPLPVKILVLDREIGHGDQAFRISTFYAYWFTGKDRETASHYERMLWMATDRIFRSVSHRWSYISVSGICNEFNGDFEQVVIDFIQEFYPQIIRSEELKGIASLHSS